MPVVSTFDAEALGEYFDKHPDTLAEVSQYILQKAPLIQAQSEGSNFFTISSRSCVTSGSTGAHIILPLDGRFTYAEVQRGIEGYASFS